MEMIEIRRAIAAATAVAASLDLAAEDAVVLHNSNRVGLRLTPCDVLARAAPVGHDAAQFEVELTQRLAQAGCPVGLLEPRVEPRVHTRDGFTVTLWSYYEPVTSRVSPTDYAQALERLHVGMRKVDVPSPRFTDRVAVAEQVFADPDLSPELAAEDRAFLGSRLRSIRRAIEDRGAGEQLLHGDALSQAGMATPGADPAVRAAFLMANDLAVLLLRDRLTEVLGVDPLSEEGMTRWASEVLAVYAAGLLAAPSQQPPEPGGRA